MSAAVRLGCSARRTVEVGDCAPVGLFGCTEGLIGGYVAGLLV